MRFEIKKSQHAIKTATMKVPIITTTAACQSSFQEGHVTFASSSFVCCIKFPVFCNIVVFRSRVDFPNAGLAGLEPATCGFGDRRSTNWSYRPISRSAPKQKLLFLAKKDVLPTRRAILFPLDLVRVGLLVLPSPIGGLVLAGHQ